MHELLGYGTRDPGVMGDAGASQVRRLDHVVEQAHQRQLIRQVRLLSGDREIVARGYRRATCNRSSSCCGRAMASGHA